MAKPQPLKLSPDLEKALLAGVIAGIITEDLVNPDELSGPGRATFGAARGLFRKGAIPPLPQEAVLLVLTDVYGASRDSAMAFLEAVYGHLAASAGAEETLRRVREKHALLSLINAAAGQLQTDTFDPARLAEVLREHGSGPALSSVGSILEAKGMPEPPEYIPLSSLPKLTTRVGGIIGVTAVAGEPGIGKSTLAWQIALDAGQHWPVVYYDLENGYAAIMDRTRKIFQDDFEKIKAATSRIYLRESAKNIEADLLYIKPPALVIMDSVQKLPTSVEFRKPGIDRWVHRLEGLKKHGYYVLLISEVPRSQYGQLAFIGAFKETGEIEYSSDLALQLIPTTTGAEIHVVKNRHGEARGLISTVRRERSFLWREL